MLLKELADNIKNQNISADAAVTHAVKQIIQLNPSINTVIAERFDNALNEAGQINFDQPFAGIPILIKDLFCDVRGLPSTHGSKAHLKNIATSDSPIVKKLKSLGFITLGKTNTAEFGLSTTTEPKAFGPTKNPFDLTQSAGGSSGGAAAAVVAGMAPLAHASDAGGSIRIPAAYCGLVGLKPSIDPQAKTPKEKITCQHVLTTSVEDSQLVLNYLRPDLPKHTSDHKPYKIALMMEHPLHPISQICQKKVYKTADALEKLGHTIKPTPFHLDWDLCVKTFITIISENLTHYLTSTTTKQCETPTQLLYALGNQITADDLEYAQQALTEIQAQTQLLLNQYDFILSPTTANPAPPLQSQKTPRVQKCFIKLACSMNNRKCLDTIYKKLTQTLFKEAPFTMPYNLAGCPAISLPIAWEKANPCAIQIAAPMFQDHKLLNLSRALLLALPAIDTPLKFL
jgi:amidase